MIKQLLNPSLWRAALASVAFTSCPARAVTTYEAVEPTDFHAGGWDLNIFADDVHFHHGGIITNVTMNLAIKGEQTCRIWIFDGLDRDALYSATFTNQPSDWADYRAYDFPLHLDVPKDIYIGFSAEGDGWQAELVDFSDNATNVVSGIETNRGIYAWGAATNGWLTDRGDFGSDDFFRMRVDMIQPEITDFVVSNQTAELWISDLSTNATYSIERSFDLSTNLWESAGGFAPQTPDTTWSEPLSNSWTNVHYRVLTLP